MPPARLRLVIYLALALLLPCVVLVSAQFAPAGWLEAPLEPAQRWRLASLCLLLAVVAVAAVEQALEAAAAPHAPHDEALQRLALVAEHTSSMVLITDEHDRIQWVNDAFARISGWQPDEVIGRRPADFLHSNAADPAARADLQDALRKGLAARLEMLHRTRQGRDLWLDVDLRPLHDEQGVLTGFMSVNTDVSARVMQQAKVQALWKLLPTGVVVRGAAGDVLEMNPAAERLLGASVAQLQGLAQPEPGWRLVREDLSDFALHELPALRTLATAQSVNDTTVGVMLPDGGTRWLQVNTEPQLDALGQSAGVVCCFSDITERRLLQDHLSRHANTDALTQLPNRSAVMQRLALALDHADRYPGYGFALLFIDFDRFKQVNDTLGHAAGDDLLCQIARRLQRALRPGDALARLAPAGEAARIGGDEFVVVLEGVNNLELLGTVADRVLQELSEPYLIGCTPLQGSASIGVVLHLGAATDSTPGAPHTAEEVLRNADTAMYEAKRAGRSRWVLFDDSMHERAMRSLALESELRCALAEDALFVVYQPVLELTSRKLVAVEALVRWRHPQRGMLLPADFIGVAEDSGLMEAIGAQVLRQACTQFMRWRTQLGEQAPPSLAVNLSRAQIRHEGMVADLRDLLDALSMRPEWLQFELTESLAAQDEAVQATLRQIKGLGVQLALDDFGSGYSSLACLHQLPVDTVKIDRSFVSPAQSVDYHRVLVEATIRLARSLGMKTVAEGIETEEQAALMLALECDRGQGHLFSQPLEAAALESWLQREDTLHTF